MTAWLWPLALLGVTAGAIWFYVQFTRAGRVEEKLDQAEATITEVGDAATIRNRVTGLPGERERLRRKWGKRDLPGA